MELRGGLERRRRLVAKAEGREIECPGPALSSALTSCPSWRKLCHNEELQATLINTLSAVRMQPRNRDFEPGFEGPSGVGALDLHVLRVPPPLSPCYGEIISLLPSCSSGIANFPQAIVIKMNFPAKPGPETTNSPCFLPVIREYQGESGRQAPLQPGLDPAEFAPQQARMEPRRPEMCECGRVAGGDGFSLSEIDLRNSSAQRSSRRSTGSRRCRRGRRSSSRRPGSAARPWQECDSGSRRPCNSRPISDGPGRDEDGGRRSARSRRPSPRTARSPHWPRPHGLRRRRRRGRSRE